MYLEDYFQHFAFRVITLLFMSDLRVGEATALLWETLDFETSVLKVTKSLYYRSMKSYEFTEPKAKAGIRNVVLDENTLNHLLKWKSVQQNTFGNEFILSANGLPTNKWSVARMIDRFSALAGVHRIKIHGLRHSHASLLISIGENPLVIKERLGHEDIETTLGTYGHLYPRSNFEVATKLKSAVFLKTSIINNDSDYSKFKHKNF